MIPQSAGKRDCKNENTISQVQSNASQAHILQSLTALNLLALAAVNIERRPYPRRRRLFEAPPDVVPLDVVPLDVVPVDVVPLDVSPLDVSPLDVDPPDAVPDPYLTLQAAIHASFNFIIFSSTALCKSSDEPRNPSLLNSPCAR